MQHKPTVRYLGRGEFEVEVLKLNRTTEQARQVIEKKIVRQLEGMVVSWIDSPRTMVRDRGGYRLYISKEWAGDYERMQVPYQEVLQLSNGAKCLVLYTQPPVKEVIAE